MASRAGVFLPAVPAGQTADHPVGTVRRIAVGKQLQ